MDNSTRNFLNVMEKINVMAKELDYANGIDWIKEAAESGVVSRDAAVEFRSAYNLRNALCHGSARDIVISEETLDFVIEIYEIILQVIEDSGAPTMSKTRMFFMQNSFSENDLCIEKAAMPALTPEPAQNTLAWYLQAAENGDVAAQCEVGRRYATGEGVGEDSSEALKWYRMAAQQGHTGAQLLLGEWYEQGIGVTADAAEALKWYCMAADNSDAELQYKLAAWYECGIGTPPDRDEACNWYKKAADQGHADAQYKLASYYARLPDKKPALKYYHMAAEQNHTGAQVHLGIHYQEEDETEAVKWLTKAAKQGDDNALYLLSDYCTGEDIVDDDGELEESYIAAAQAGDPCAMYTLGSNYFYGSGGIPKDFEKAVRMLYREFFGENK